ncbi:hypothetical protein QQ045_009787 [Rhodiola kirilowii]
MVSYWTYVYGTHDPHTRHQIWDEIILDRQDLNEPWFVLGDFSTIFDWSEKDGGDRSDDGSMIDFNIFQVRAGLTYLGFSGNPYTWSNNQQASNRVWQRLDRILSNAQGLAQFPLAKVTHLPRVCSDHYPLLFHSCETAPRRTRFHYQKMWHKHHGFKEIVKAQCDGQLHINPLLNFAFKLKRLRLFLRSWNWQVFGNIHTKINQLNVQVSVLEHDIHNQWNSEKARSLDTLEVELNDLEVSQLELLQAKAKMAWLQQGDINTSLFDTALKPRGRGLSVNLDMGDDTFSSDPDTIGDAAALHFASIFQGHTPPPPEHLMDLITPIISEAENESPNALP